ncbi:MAG TPA: hypothetical protein VFE77_03095 [Rhodanobacter sp.]|nr:hypothetical protein [Rhodanobacter sp.]
MSTALVIIPGLCYLGIAIAQGFKGDWNNVLIYSGYALAVVGLVGKLS